MQVAEWFVILVDVSIIGVYSAVIRVLIYSLVTGMFGLLRSRLKSPR